MTVYTVKLSSYVQNWEQELSIKTYYRASALIIIILALCRAAGPYRSTSPFPQFLLLLSLLSSSFPLLPVAKRGNLTLNRTVRIGPIDCSLHFPIN